MKKYYLIKIFYRNKNWFLIWYSDDVDGVVANGNRISIFENIDQVVGFAKDNGIVLEEGLTILNIIDITNLTEKTRNVMLSYNCKELFDIWNILGDIAMSTNDKFIGNSDDEVTRDVYEKLFYGSNLRIINRDMEEYHPMFDED